ncbi:hypothetical protein [Nesterenkonia pannonica]|uniref:hypothetical protein n=1 Tax=Nesterenkonia pannonica TaxID=1548602 RepID=UPI002164C059|nr:hypothetical protein [Nesterenkonia pannonica]
MPSKPGARRHRLRAGRAHPAQAEFAGKDPALRRLHAQAATVLFEANPRGAQQVLDQLDLASATDADQLERMAVRYMKLGEFEAALAMRQRAAALDPTTPSAPRPGPLPAARQQKGLTRDPVLGLRPGGEPQVDEAREALRAAAELAPGHPAVLREQGDLEFAHGDQDHGLALLEEAVAARPTAAGYKDLGQRYRKPQIQRLDDALSAYESSLQLNPATGRSSEPSSPSAAAPATTGPASGAAPCSTNAPGAAPARNRQPTAQPPHRRVRRPLHRSAHHTRTRTQRRSPSGSHRGARGLLSWPTTALITYRLQFAGHLTAYFRLRRQLAERTREWLGSVSAGHAYHRQKLLAAEVYLDRLDEALALIDPMPWKPQSPLAAQQLRKLAADVHLLRGSTGPYLEYSCAARAQQPMQAEGAAEQLVAGKRVAIVGPVDTGDRLGSSSTATTSSSGPGSPPSSSSSTRTPKAAAPTSSTSTTTTSTPP